MARKKDLSTATASKGMLETQGSVIEKGQVKGSTERSTKTSATTLAGGLGWQKGRQMLGGGEGGQDTEGRTGETTGRTKEGRAEKESETFGGKQ